MLRRILKDGAGADADGPVMLFRAEIRHKADRGHAGGHLQAGFERREVAIDGGTGDRCCADSLGIGSQRRSVEIDRRQRRNEATAQGCDGRGRNIGLGAADEHDAFAGLQAAIGEDARQGRDLRGDEAEGQGVDAIGESNGGGPQPRRPRNQCVETIRGKGIAPDNRGFERLRKVHGVFLHQELSVASRLGEP